MQPWDPGAINYRCLRYMSRHRQRRPGSVGRVPIEVVVDGWVRVAFDGRVVEQFGGSTREGSRRWHVTEIVSATVGTDRKGRSSLQGWARNKGFFGCDLDPGSEETARQLVAELDRVRADVYGLGPVAG